MPIQEDLHLCPASREMPADQTDCNGGPSPEHADQQAGDTGKWYLMERITRKASCEQDIGVMSEPVSSLHSACLAWPTLTRALCALTESMSAADRCVC